MTPLPTGTVTFLFTDIEGSTKHLYSLGEEGYASALDEHRRICRAAFVQHGGVEFGTEGDAFFVAFPTAQGAVAAAVEAQSRLAEGVIHVRMGVHTGTPLLTVDGYLGVDLHRVARIAAAGHGGQVLVSHVTAALTNELGLKDLGAHRLKDLASAERIFQVGDAVFPPLRSLYRTNLPVQATPFLGRTKELSAVAELLCTAGVRLVTLTGPGGTGKTRLAAQAAAEVADRFPDGIFWVALDPLRDPALVASSILQAIGVAERSERTSRDRLITALAGKRMLLALDNAEHLLPAFADDLSSLLTEAPTVSVLVTSRERLRLKSEHSYAVPPLSQDDGVSLFLARALDRSLARTDAVNALCERLEFLPLALELAAARTGLYTPEQLLARLGQRLDLLTGDRDADPRQRTLRATIAWSYDLLGASEQRAFCRSGVFIGGATLEAIESICGAEPDTLQSLLDKSLLRREGDRYFMLETIREYALERLESSGEANEIRRRRTEWYVAYSERIEPDLYDAESTAAASLLELDHDNLRAALRHALKAGEQSLLLRGATALAPFWNRRGHITEGIEWVEHALRISSREPSLLLAKAHNRTGGLAMLKGDLASAREHFEECARTARAVGEEPTLATANGNLGFLAMSAGDYVDATKRFEEATNYFAVSGDELGAAIGLNMLAHVELLQGNVTRAAEHDGAGLALSRKVGNDSHLAAALHTSGMIRLTERAFVAARVALEEAVAAAVAAHDPAVLVAAVEGFAAVRAGTDDWEPAARLFGFAEAFRAESGISDPLTAMVAAPYVALVRARLPAFSEVARAWDEGRTMTLDEAVALGRRDSKSEIRTAY